MAYQLRTDEELASGLRRIAAELIEKAIAVFSDDSLERDAAVHQARQGCKKVRALVRLLREKHPEVVRVENAKFRDAAASLAHFRNADALLETFDHFRKHATAGNSRLVLDAVHQVLKDRRQSIHDADVRVQFQIEGFIADMNSARERAKSWFFGIERVSDIMPGFAHSQRRGRRAMKECRRAPSKEAFHEWRKWSKYQLYQTRLLKPFLRGSLKDRSFGLKRRGKKLGIDHDLAVLRHELVSAPDFSTVRGLIHFGGLLQSIDRQHKQLQRRSLKIGKELYVPDTTSS